jgi:hypothetical protein
MPIFKEFGVCHDWGEIAKLVSYHSTEADARASAIHLKKSFPSDIKVFVVRNYPEENLSAFLFYV